MGYFCWLLVSAGQSNVCIYQFSRKLQTTLSFVVFEFETKTWKRLFSMKFIRLTNLMVLKLKPAKFSEMIQSISFCHLGMNKELPENTEANQFETIKCDN